MNYKAAHFKISASRITKQVGQSFKAFENWEWATGLSSIFQLPFSTDFWMPFLNSLSNR